MTKRLLIIVLALTWAAGCTASQQQEAQRQANDAAIAAQVLAKAAMVDPAALAEVHVKVSRGVVTLSGETRSAADRRKIEAAARSIGGVKSVVDRIAVNPHARTTHEIAVDASLQAQVAAALAAQTGVNATRLTVGVYRGVVTISGTLRTRALHDTAIETARGVNGVRRVIDKIHIQR
jgi:hyperosmotically inducible periplasmic protein